MERKKYCGCIAVDLISSRNYYSEETLVRIRDLLNDKYKAGMVTPFTFRNGDELIGQVHRFSDCYHVLSDLFTIMKLFDKGAYVGIGFGTIETIEHRDIHQVNGSAIRSAMTARDQFLKKKRPPVKLYNDTKNKKGVQYYCYSEDETIPCEIINHMIYFIKEKVEKRTDKQNKVIHFFENNPKITYQEMSEFFSYESDIEPNISKLLQRANYYLVNSAEESLIQLLDFLQENLLR